jgi:hypothetical protein
LNRATQSLDATLQDPARRGKFLSAYQFSAGPIETLRASTHCIQSVLLNLQTIHNAFFDLTSLEQKFGNTGLLKLSIATFISIISAVTLN